MSDEHWAVVMQNNDMLHGLQVNPGRQSDEKLTLNGIERSFLPGTSIEYDATIIFSLLS